MTTPNKPAAPRRAHRRRGPSRSARRSRGRRCRARDVHLHRAALRPAEPRALDERGPPVVEPHRARLLRGAAPARRRGARPVLRHRRHGVRAAPSLERRAHANHWRRLLARHAGARGAEIRGQKHSLGRGRRAESAVRNRPVPTGDFGVRISQSRQLRSRAGGDLSRARARTAKSASSISASPKACSASSIACTSAACCPPSARSSRACAGPTPTCLPRCCASLRPTRCWSACAPPASAMCRGRPTRSASRGCIGGRSKSPPQRPRVLCRINQNAACHLSERPVLPRVEGPLSPAMYPRWNRGALGSACPNPGRLRLSMTIASL